MRALFSRGLHSARIGERVNFEPEGITRSLTNVKAKRAMQIFCSVLSRDPEVLHCSLSPWELSILFCFLRMDQLEGLGLAVSGRQRVWQDTWWLWTRGFFCFLNHDKMYTTSRLAF